MMRTTLLLSLLISNGIVWAADPQAGRQVEARVPERVEDPLIEMERRQPALDGLQVEQVCPSYTMWDIAPAAGWNTVEVGLSFPLGETGQRFQPYTRYTCRGPGAR